MAKYLNLAGLSTLVDKVKSYVQTSIAGKASKASSGSGTLAAIDSDGNYSSSGISSRDAANAINAVGGKQDAIYYEIADSTTDGKAYCILMPTEEPSQDDDVGNLAVYGGLKYYPKTGVLTANISGIATNATYAANVSSGSPLRTELNGKMATDGSNAGSDAPKNILNKLPSSSQTIATGYTFPIRYDASQNSSWYYATMSQLFTAMTYFLGWDGSSAIGGSSRPLYLNSQGKFALCDTYPTVYPWAQSASKPTYTASEVGAYTKSEVDSKTKRVYTGLGNGLQYNVLFVLKSSSVDAISEVLTTFRLTYTTYPIVKDYSYIIDFDSTGSFRRNSGENELFSAYVKRNVTYHKGANIDTPPVVKFVKNYNNVKGWCAAVLDLGKKYSDYSRYVLEMGGLFSNTNVEVVFAERDSMPSGVVDDSITV